MSKPSLQDYINAWKNKELSAEAAMIGINYIMNHEEITENDVVWAVKQLDSFNYVKTFPLRSPSEE